MVSLILTDFDGTLFPKSGGELTDAFKTKITKLTDCGCIFAVNSGRPYSALKDLLRPLLNRTVFICNDGAQIMYKNCLLYKNPVCAVAANEICHKINTESLKPFAALRERNMPITDDVMAKKRLFGEEIYKLIFVKNNPLNEEVEALKAASYEKGLRLCFEDNEYIEFCNSSADKGAATEFLKTKFGISGEVAAFGDTPGDFAMFEKADKVYIPKIAEITYPGAKIIDNVQEHIINEL